MLNRVLKVLGGLLLLVLVGVGGMVAYASATHDARAYFADTPYPELSASTDPAVIERGRYLVHGPAHCSQCHSTDDREGFAKIPTAPLQGGLEFDMGPIARTWAPNLTPDKETGLGRYTDREVARSIRSGVLPDGSYSLFMATAAAKPSDEDLVAILSYLRSIEPIRHEVPRGEWRTGGKVLLSMLTLAPSPSVASAHVAAADEPSVARGQYLAHNVALCVSCHSKIDMATMQPVAPLAGGGNPEPSHGADSHMEFVTPNLTSHPTGVTGKLDEEAFVARMMHGRAHNSSIMPWENIQAMTDSDLRSVYRYLRTLPPVDNDVGPTYRRGGWKPGDDTQ